LSIEERPPGSAATNKKLPQLWSMDRTPAE
jgi:hypothetical protein